MRFTWFRRKARHDGGIAGAGELIRSRLLAGLDAASDAAPATRDGPAQGADAGVAVAAARSRPIVFRQTYPPPPEPGLSFYGGTPMGPAGMPWPRGRADNRPLTFVMQWDGAALAREDATGLLPGNGALYLFSNLAWGDKMEFRFLHAAGDQQGWAPLPVPEDLPPAFDGNADWSSPLLSPHVPADRRGRPRLLPRWPFALVGINYPPASASEGDGDGKMFWADRTEVKEMLVRAQDPRATLITNERSTYVAFGRPFPAFPQDWAAVRVMAAAALRKLARPSALDWRQFLPDADEATRAINAAAWQKEALALYDEAVRHPAGGAMPQERADAIWRRLETLEASFWPNFGSAVEEPVNASLGLDSEGVAAIPPEWIEVGALNHSLDFASIREEYEHEFRHDHVNDLPWQEVTALYKQAKAAGELKRIRDVFAPTPNRIFGPPSFVQGDVDEYVNDWLLLLELSSSRAIGLRMGDGVLQFLIRPEDLRERRFDRVRAIITGY